MIFFELKNQKNSLQLCFFIFYCAFAVGASDLFFHPTRMKKTFDLAFGIFFISMLIVPVLMLIVAIAGFLRTKFFQISFSSISIVSLSIANDSQLPV